MNTFDYGFSPVENVYRPNYKSLYPGERKESWSVPEEISRDWHKLNSVIETKYTREYLKVCAFYNKLFPSLKYSDWQNMSYNVQPFTSIDQERNDTGTGISANYLKQVVDQVVARVGTISFVPSIQAEEPTLEYIIYKDEVERVLRKMIADDKLNAKASNAFHDAAILGYSHMMVDPWLGSIVKANDFEIGMYESEFNKGKVTKMMFRDYAFPVSEALRYVRDEDDIDTIAKECASRTSVDLKMYFDCDQKKAWCTINNRTLEPIDYPFDTVLVTTFCWDEGFTKTTSTSLFDLLYPMQREINKIKAKIQQIIRMYKGATPVFNSDVDLALKSITNGSGECLYVDSSRPIDTLMTVINPTPIDSELDALVTSIKTEMMEIAGLQASNFDMENMRSAAAVVALDQLRDTVFQRQLEGKAEFIKSTLKMYIDWFAHSAPSTFKNIPVDWQSIQALCNDAAIQLQAKHLNEYESKEYDGQTDYMQLSTTRLVLGIIKGDMTFDTLPYYTDPNELAVIIAAYMVRFDGLGIPVPDTMHHYLIAVYIDGVKRGDVQL